VRCKYRPRKWLRAISLELLGRHRLKPGEFYMLIAVHPECNLIFLKGGMRPEEPLMSYDMDNKKLHVICSLRESQAWRFQPYIPRFVVSPSDVHDQLTIC
jgi:hypothetical protein